MLDKSELKSVTSQDTTLSSEEIARFDRMAEQWWDPNGDYKMALLFNEARVAYFVETICSHFKRSASARNCLSGLNILDLGCGGGLVSEALALKGAKVVGIDASQTSVEVAKRHAVKSGVSVDYRHQTSKQLVDARESFDVVINAEVIEHVPDQKTLVKHCAYLTRVGGLTILATLNRTVKSYFFGIIGAEYIMRYLPVGTHSWGLFVTPLELNSWASMSRLQLIEEKGMSYNMFTKSWKLNANLSVNYVQVYKKLPPQN
ncbi:bifunctional 2-polyprenyl-6-hydroxyphenol methylase/3-demethylubiquinol 3-O-methyltransferase UbiG [Glaciecola sp. 1036]|uniref:bifunctional 2-polyprenyl-6-hydroxyphenol methylase/3-demethylubiquinol 3-O-methyltransferase UbiG n=1 Tax=Alteromonadaceae TaxID=72275 RepID=UPI003D0456EA